MDLAEFTQARQRAGLDQRDWARALDISQRYISLIERGQRPISSLLTDRARVAERFGNLVRDKISRLERKRDWRSSVRFSQRPPFPTLPGPGIACGCGRPNCRLVPERDGDWKNAGHLWLFYTTICRRTRYLNERGETVHSPGPAGMPLVPAMICGKCGLPRNLQKRWSRNLACEILSRNCYGRPGEHDPPILFWVKADKIVRLPPDALQRLDAGPNPLSFEPHCRRPDCPFFEERLKRPWRLKLKGELFLIYKCPGNHLERFHVPGGEPAERLRAGAGSCWAWTDSDTKERCVVESEARPAGGYPIKRCPEHGCKLIRKKGPWLSRTLKQRVWKMRCAASGEYYRLWQNGKIEPWPKAMRKKRGRRPGRTPELERRIALVASLLKLGWSLNAMSRFVYPDTLASAYSNVRNLMADHRLEIEQKTKIMTLSEAEGLVRPTGALS